MPQTRHVLGLTDESAHPPFASMSNYQGDVALLNYLLQDVRVLVRRARKGEVEIMSGQVITWSVHGLARRIVVRDPAGLQEPSDVQIVGFFGDRRAGSDQAMVDTSELGLIDELANYSGILSYSSVELVDHHWANLVIHRKIEDRELWRTSERHRYAVDEVAPVAYHTVRIHNGCIKQGVVGSQTVLIETTKYWDYDQSPVWHAIRDLAGHERELADEPPDGSAAGDPTTQPIDQ